MSADDTAAGSKAKNFYGLAAAFLLFSVGGPLLLYWLHAGWIGAAVFVVLLIGGTIVLMRSAQRIGAQMGCASPAIARYNKRMMWSSIGYMVALFTSVSLYNRGMVSGALLWPMSLVPALAVLGMVWAMARLLIEETDEYLRFRLTRQALFACGGLLAISTVWGFLEQFGLVVHIPAWASVPVFALMLGVGQCFRWVRS